MKKDKRTKALLDNVKPLNQEERNLLLDGWGEGYIVKKLPQVFSTGDETNNGLNYLVEVSDNYLTPTAKQLGWRSFHRVYRSGYYEDNAPCNQDFHIFYKEGVAVRLRDANTGARRIRDFVLFSEDGTINDGDCVSSGSAPGWGNSAYDGVFEHTVKADFVAVIHDRQIEGWEVEVVAGTPPQGFPADGEKIVEWPGKLAHRHGLKIK